MTTAKERKRTVSKKFVAAAGHRAVFHDTSGDRITKTIVVEAKMPASFEGFRAFVRNASPLQRVHLEREGVPSRVVKYLIDETGMSSTEFQSYVRMPKATFTKKMKEKAQFSGTTGQAVVGWIDLINMVEAMLAAEPDNVATRDFDAEKWVGNWIQRPQRALGGLAPAELMDTPTGRESVMRVLGAVQSGAYQ